MYEEEYLGLSRSRMLGVAVSIVRGKHVYHVAAPLECLSLLVANACIYYRNQLACSAYMLIVQPQIAHIAEPVKHVPY